MNKMYNCLLLQNAPLGAVSGCEQGTVRVWDLLTGACVHKLTRVGQSASSMSGDVGVVGVVGTPVYVVSVTSDSCLSVWERCRGVLLHTIHTVSLLI